MGRDRSALTAITLGALLAACTAGSAPGGPPLPVEREPPGEGQEPAANGPERTPGGRESPGGGSENGGSSSGGGDSGVTCLACGTSFTCTVVGQTKPVTVKLQPSGGKCYLGSPNDGSEIRCDGTIVTTVTDSSGKDHTSQTPWTPFGNGGFQLTTQTGVAVQCVPERVAD